jgi:hypothetical protein
MLYFVLRHVCIVLENFVHANAIFADNLPVRVFELELVHAFVDPRYISWRELCGECAARDRGQDEWHGQQEQISGFWFHATPMISGEDGLR